MSYQDGRRVEALEAAVRELWETVAGLRRENERLEREVSSLRSKLTERPALARRRA